MIDVDLLKKVDIGTPHVAGYSYDGKVAAVKMLYDEACRYFGKPAVWTPSASDALIPHKSIIADRSVQNSEKALLDIVRQCYDIVSDDLNLHMIVSLPDHERRLYFQRLRREYRIRREFFNTTVVGPPDGVADTLLKIGFQLA